MLLKYLQLYIIYFPCCIDTEQWISAHNKIVYHAATKLVEQIKTFPSWRAFTYDYIALQIIANVYMINFIHHSNFRTHE